ncbi:hypothetical protein V6L77_06305 [Pannonibacter sp. Pt2-lr]
MSFLQFNLASKVISLLIDCLIAFRRVLHCCENREAFQPSRAVWTRSRKIVAQSSLLRKILINRARIFLRSALVCFIKLLVVHAIRLQQKGEMALGLGDGKAIFYIEVRDEDWITARGH